MTVGQAKKLLAEFDDDAELVLMRVGPRNSRIAEDVEQLINGDSLTGYNRDFGGKAVIW